MLKISALNIFCLLSTVISQDSYRTPTELPPVPPLDPPNPPRFQSSPSETLHRKFITDAMKLILSKGVFEDAIKTRRIPYVSPPDMEETFDFRLEETGKTDEELLEIITEILERSPKPGHRYQLDKRTSGLDPLAVAGDWLAATMSNLVVTYLVAPVWTMMEIKMTEYLSKSIGWSEPGEGLPTSGAAAANALAISAALHNFNAEYRDLGLYPALNHQSFRVIVSKHASTAWNTAMIYNGLGMEMLTRIDVDSQGRMPKKALEDHINALQQSNNVIIMVVLTAGTPTFGAIDDLHEVGTMVKSKGVWLHVDAEKAGGFLFTEGASHKSGPLFGIKSADSVTVGSWLMQTPTPSAMLLTKNPSALQNAFGLHAPYVFTGIDLYNMSYDMGDHTIQTSRRPEIAKLWFAAQRGEASFKQMFDLMEQNRNAFIEILQEHLGFYVVYPMASGASSGDANSKKYSLPLVSFYYVPEKRVENLKPGSEQYNTRMSEIMSSAALTILELGYARLTYSTWPEHEPKKRHGFLTVALTNTRDNREDYYRVVELVRRAADDDIPEHGIPLPAIIDNREIALPTYPHLATYGNFLRQVFDLFLEEGIFFKRSSAPSMLLQPEELDQKMDFSLPASGENVFQKILEQFRDIIKYSPHWGHPYFIYQLAAGLDPYTLVADYMVPVLSTPMITYKDNPVFAVMEKELVRKMLDRVYGPGSEGEGIITDGGSMANQIAIALAKYHAYGKAMKMTGMSYVGAKYIIFLSEDAHYSVKKGAIIEGIGQNYTIEVESNSIGQMDVSKLILAINQAKEANHIPLMVVVTTGTTIYGAIDPINEIVDVAKAYNMWVHIDGMFGGLLSLSDTHAQKLRGIERSDSFGADLHKLFGSTMVCSILVTSHPNLLRETFDPDEYMRFGLHEGYDQEDMLKDHMPYNQAGRHWQLDKRNNMFKFWLLWKAKGRLGLQQHVDRIMENKDFLVSELKRRKEEGFEPIISDFEVTNVCFIFKPIPLNSDQNPGVVEGTAHWNELMDKVAFEIEKELLKNGVMNIVAQDRHTKNTEKYQLKFLKFVMMGSALTKEDITYLLDAVKHYGNRINVIDLKNRAHPGHDHGFDAWGNLPKYVPLSQFTKGKQEMTGRSANDLNSGTPKKKCVKNNH